MTRIHHYTIIQIISIVLENYLHSSYLLGAFPGDANGKESACQCRKYNEMWVQFLGQKDTLEEGMATHSSILVWKIPWTEEPGGFQSIGSHRVGHDLAFTHAESNYAIERVLANCSLHISY